MEGWISSYATIATGKLSAVSETAGELTGHLTMALASFPRRRPESYQQRREMNRRWYRR